jgi:hypothetical protein
MKRASGHVGDRDLRCLAEIATAGEIAGRAHEFFGP